MDDLKRIRLKIKDDKRYKKVRDIFKTNDLFQLPLAEYQEEARKLFKMRKIRTLNISDTNALSKVAESIIQDQAYRSRMTEILTTIHSASKLLNDMLERFQDYASVTYAKDLKAVGAAKERERCVRNVMVEYYRYADNLETVVAELDLYIKDIDKCGFAYRALVDTLNIINQREYGLPNSRK
ncbi:hypothetical protein pEaSNUABM14_00174 [Erwinia phage pEa_SNUABM_14]|uniref:Uncharacterized protein n=1 Tax=Erwinia phage pEa_SNUABM_7 TaxID=2866695 RepID=A0AAE8BP47_9CAUD|nr:hypothetical protein MPK74_gp175 [Erwinia phage pEa_SNUABM_7]QYW03134.1 hypothetical protein pEaSNUABM13_00175 [Erwinia phage pEa_SNUABM_13]QYW03475.1 hypothetical protein pEaSNUABM34_00173 [Erwinia phage pEa_SNUABM_34]QYW03817.1 hypothetical protein pEaSNUABM45_00174 [Erwinia phage pEa_SNUABM_45]QYW04158.1 hypothetical protein pEaSNUABM46_00174 [Erwinia phage pEa_SNUABM_46]QYW04499.1 hypothetical protein pEaSNUABM14_00174 [Erwinia phage pEa_SNUABM_14]QYW05188.1 hypothetical protein pEaSNU